MGSILAKLRKPGQPKEFVFWVSYIQLAVTTQSPILRILLPTKLSEDLLVVSAVLRRGRVMGRGCLGYTSIVLSKTVADPAGSGPGPCSPPPISNTVTS